ncbi:acyltransferase family protein [Lichenicoccus sp.]|uniref:acyltransferase family protein n=1 Tax=Lichenicoccus sp. TaxID=2781899 RepID=UPI003D0CBE0E
MPADTATTSSGHDGPGQSFPQGRPAVDRLGRHELPALTSIRGLLAWWVVLFHFAPTAPFHVGRGDPFIEKGIVAVDCFFVLSGFVLCHVHPVIIDRDRAFGTADFLVSRLARIYPLHLAMLAAFALVVAAFRLSHPYDGGAAAPFAADRLPGLLRQLVLLHGWFRWGHETAWNVPSWSISSEWAAYLLAPLLFLSLRRLRPAFAWLAAGLLAACITGLAEAHLLFEGAMALPRVLTEFCLGALLRTALRHGHAGLDRTRTAGLAAGWLAALGLAFTTHAGLFLAAMIWLLLLLSLRTRRATGGLRHVERIGLYLGETSFAVYMCHAFILMLWGGDIAHKFPALVSHALPAALLLVAAIQGCASLLHHLVELPAQRGIRRRFRAWTQARSQAATTAGEALRRPA